MNDMRCLPSKNLQTGKEDRPVNRVTLVYQISTRARAREKKNTAEIYSSPESGKGTWRIRRNYLDRGENDQVFQAVGISI